MQVLTTKINRTKPVFIQCIRAYETPYSRIFNSASVKDQLRDACLVEFAQIRKFTYPIKFEFGAFLNRYQFLFRALNLTNFLSPKEFCYKILQSFFGSGFCLGTTKVFIKYEKVDVLDMKQYEFINSQVEIDNNLRQTFDDQKPNSVQHNPKKDTIHPQQKILLQQQKQQSEFFNFIFIDQLAKPSFLI